jgi:hypothetical protein
MAELIASERRRRIEAQVQRILAMGFISGPAGPIDCGRPN